MTDKPKLWEYALILYPKDESQPALVIQKPEHVLARTAEDVHKSI